MGVNGLWRLIEPSGKPVPVETLENQVLAVDVSIWLHQVTKGFQDASGNALPNAHLLGLFHRLCKLLFYKIKPVFVFDGGIPHLKKQTVAARRQQKGKAEQIAERMREKLLQNFIKHNAVKNVLGSQAWESEVSMPKVRSEDDMFQLPPPSQAEEQSDSGSESSEETVHHKYTDLHTLDVKSAHFRSLPADMRHDILVELKETRKQSSWGRLHEIPKESKDFSTYQMNRLLKRRSVQVSLEEAEKEMGGKTLSLGELEELMAENGIITDSDIGKRIASDSTTRFIYINGSKNETSPVKDVKGTDSSNDPEEEGGSTALEYKKVPSPSASNSNEMFDYEDYDYDEIDDIEWSFKFSEEEGEEDEDNLPSNMKVAKNFMFENSGLTQAQILAIIKTQNRIKKSEKKIPPPIDGPSTSKMSFKESKSIDNVIHEKLSITSKTDAVNTTTCPEPDDIGECSREKQENGKSISGKSDIQIVSDSESDAELVEVEVTPSSSSISHECGEKSNSGNMDDVRTLDKNSNKEILKSNKGNSFDVVIQPNNFDAEDDIFADIFSKDSSENNKSTESSRVDHLDKCTSLEIVLQPNDFEEKDDIFADVFSKTPEELQNRNEMSRSDNIKAGDTKKDISIKQTEESGIQIDDVSVTNYVSTMNNKENSSTSIAHLKYNSDSSKHEQEGKLTTDAHVVICESVGINVGSTLKVNRVSEFESTSHVKQLISQCVSNNPGNKDSNADKFSTVRSLTGSSDGVLSRNSTDLQDIIEVDNESESDSDKDEHQKPVLDAATSERLQRLQNSLEDEHYRLMVERGKQDRLATNITDQMHSEAQELLRLFGVPYIVAPMEAEAQCAFLDAVSLTDGTITDDSDIWLFGGQQVYRNFFNQKKHVMKFKASDIQHYFKLSRQQMILLALLVGSDYTVGLQGIGPVTALEILAAFPPENSQEEQEEKEQLISALQNFRNWWATGKAVGPAKISLRSKIKDIRIHAGFPSSAVIEAYLCPKVDDSKEKFSWSNPDLTALRRYAMEKFGWAQTKTDSILLPVMKKLNERNSQQTLDSFIRSKPKLPLAEGKVSKRVQSAIDRMGRQSDSDNDSPAPKVTKVSQPGRGRVKTSRQTNRGSKGRPLTTEDATQREGERNRGRGLMTETTPRGRGVFREINNRRGQGRGRNAMILARSGLNYEPPNESAPPTEFILQREKDKLNSLKKKLQAIEVFRKSKYGLDKTKKKKQVKKIISAPNLSESSDSD